MQQLGPRAARDHRSGRGAHRQGEAAAGCQRPTATRIPRSAWQTARSKFTAEDAECTENSR